MKPETAKKFKEVIDVLATQDKFTIDEMCELLEYSHSSSYPRRVIHYLIEHKFITKKGEWESSKGKRGQNGSYYCITKTRGVEKFLIYHIRVNGKGYLSYYKTKKEPCKRKSSRERSTKLANKKNGTGTQLPLPFDKDTQTEEKHPFILQPSKDEIIADLMDDIATYITEAATMIAESKIRELESTKQELRGLKSKLRELTE